MGTGIQLARFPTPDIESKCLPGGKQIVSVTIDFTQVPVTPGTGSFPWLLNSNGGSYLGNSQADYQLVTTNLQSNTSQPITNIKSMFYHYQSAFTINKGSMTTATLYIYNEYNGQIITLAPDSSIAQSININTGQTNLTIFPFFDGCVPFFWNQGSNINFFIGLPGSQASGSAGRFFFANFDMQPYTSFQIANMTGGD